eukprot:TRINITY_DN36326_c0_g1_i1.p1 TRINITY_DN36326_c0_g1~~TRINITY_DN36326_c0_g1_i1.p1  ORF type:complete len:873 (-),score=65.46 TRINITY_DN36326_c0_g1_i1:353-2971(-)
MPTPPPWLTVRASDRSPLDPNDPSLQPGRCLRAFAQEGRGRGPRGDVRWSHARSWNLEVLKRAQDEFLVKSIDSKRKAFWLNVVEIITDADATEHFGCRDDFIRVLAIDTQPEPAEKEDFHGREVAKLQTAMASSEHVNNNDIEHGDIFYDGYVLACSRYLVKASKLPNRGPPGNDTVPPVSLRVLGELLLGRLHSGIVIGVTQDVHVTVEFTYDSELRTGICCLEDMDFHSAKFVRSDPHDGHTPANTQRPTLGCTVHFKILAERELLNSEDVRADGARPSRQIYLSMKDINANRSGNAALSQHSKEILLERMFGHGRPLVEELDIAEFEVGSHRRSAFVRDTLRSIIEEMDTASAPPDLVDFCKHRCFAKFHCQLCDNDWSTVVGWGVYDGESDTAICDCEIDRKRLVGCRHVFKCVKDCRPNGHGRWIPKRDATSVAQWCRDCDTRAVAGFVEVYYNQPGSGRHLPEFCPECCRNKSWCTGRSAEEAPRLSRELNKLLCMIDPTLTWHCAEVGLECMFMEAETQHKYIIQVVPELFIIPEHACREGNNPENGARWTASGQEPELLRGDRMAAGVDEVEQLARSMRHKRNTRTDAGEDDHSTTADDSPQDDFLFVHSNMTRRLRNDMRIYSKNVRCTWMGSARGLYGSYGLREGEEYFKPGGWIKRHINRDDYPEIDGWPTAYHGTTFQVAARIIYDGGLRRPFSPFSTRQFGSASGRSIYVSPAIGFSAHPVYAPFYKLERRHWVQAVLQVKVRPGSYHVQSNSGRLGGWAGDLRIDPNFINNDRMEWLVEDEEDVPLTGVMFREFGPNIDTDIYEDLCAQVTYDGDDREPPAREWTRLLEGHYRAREYFAGRPVWFDEHVYSGSESES